MEIRVLKYFLMIAREENITKAADILHITQPTLSRQIIQLEEELGVKLFTRSKHSISLTEDGLLLKRRAQEIVELVDKAETEFKQKEAEISGEVVIGCGETLSMDELANVMVAFKKLYPKTVYKLHTAVTDEIKEKIEKGLIDIGLFTEPVDIAKYEYVRMNAVEEWGILVKSNSELAKREYVTVEDIKDLPLLIPKRDEIRNEIRNWFGKYFDNINIVSSINLIYNAAVMVRKGLGVAVVLRLNNEYEGLTFVPIYPKLLGRTMLVWKKNQIKSKVVEKFTEFAKEYLTKI